MGELRNPHDLFFRERLADPEVAADFLRHYLPAKVAGLLDLSAVELTRDTHVDPALREHRSDLVYRVGLHRGGEAFVYVLFEHKSHPDPMVAHQLLRYVLKLWDSRMAGRERTELPPVIPLVVYHGRAPWRVSRRFSALVPCPEGLRPYVVDFRYMLTDLNRYSDAELRGAALLKVALLCLRHVFDKDLAARLPGILAVLGDLVRSGTGIEAVETVLRYLGGASDRVSPEAVGRAVLKAFPEDGEKIMSTLHGQWIEKGRAEGREIGEILRARKAVVEALRVRFGESATPVAPILESVNDLVILEELLRKAITAPSVEEFRQDLDRILP